MSKVIIKTGDTDVVVIALGMFTRCGLDELWIEFGKGNSMKLLPIHVIFDKIGEEVAVALPVMHSLDAIKFPPSKGKANFQHGTHYSHIHHQSAHFAF